jgi:MFS family permease
LAPHIWLKTGRNVYRGWYIIGVTMAGGFMAASLSQVFMGVMLKPMAGELGWSRTAISGAVTLGTLTGGFLAPMIGRLADRHGPRAMATMGVMVLAVALLAIANVTQPWHLYAAYIVGRSISQTTLSGDVPRITAVNWFRRMRGRALGMTQMALPLGNSALALVAQLLMGNGLDWRGVFMVFSLSVLVVLLLPSFLVLRRRPQDLGLLPDGDSATVLGTTTMTPTSTEDEQGWTLSQAMRTPVLWLLITALTLGITANGAIGFHLISYFTDRGLSATMAVTALSIYALAGATANGLLGLLMERVSERILAPSTMLAASLLCAFLLTVSNGAGAIVFAILFGLAARGQSSLVMLIVAKYFGRQHFGAISGFIGPFQMVGLGLGPLWASILFDQSNSYTQAFTVVTLGFALSAALLWLAKKPRSRPVSPQALVP